MFRKIIYIIFFLLAILNEIDGLCQEQVILKGKVTDKGSGEALIGVTVIEVNELNRTLNGTVTDINGNFALKLTSAQTKVKISYIGYKTYEFPISGQTFLDVRMEEETQLLEEVSVVAEGKRVGGFIPVSKRDLTSAVSTV